MAPARQTPPGARPSRVKIVPVQGIGNDRGAARSVLHPGRLHEAASNSSPRQMIAMRAVGNPQPVYRMRLIGQLDRKKK